MSVTPPLQLSDFWRKIRFAYRPEFELLQYRQQNMDGAGNVLSNRLGSPKWQAAVRTAGGRHDADMDVQAMVKLLLGRDAAFFAYDIRQPWPAYDPGGAILSGSGFSPTIRTVGSNNRSLSLTGMPNRYKLAAGEKISFASGSGQVQLLELMEPAEANGAHNTPEFEVQPFLPTWIAPGQAVDVTRPRGKFKIVAGSYKPQDGQANRSSGISFSMISVT